MSFLFPDPPTPPNPYDTARASTSTNVATGVANAYLGNVNQVTPQGSLTYNASGTYDWNDPVTNTKYSIPTFTATQTLSPSQQALQGQTEAAQYNMAGMANNLSGNIARTLSQPVSLSGAPTGGDASTLSGIPGPQTSFSSGGQIQQQLGDPGALTRDYGPADNYSADRSRVEDSLMQRMNPQLERERSAIEQRLADQGIRYGSQAYTSAMDDYSRQANDARFAAVAQGGQEQQRMNQMSAQRAAFQNEAQQQAFNQELGSGTFANSAQGQQFQQNAAQGSFSNSALAQQMAQAQSAFNAAQAQRNAYMNEQYANRNQGVNEITALMSGSQVTNPNFVNTPSSQIPTTDMAGLINNNFNQQMGIYGQQNQNYQSLMGGLLGLGAGAIKASDRRVKKDIERIGTVFSAKPREEAEELPIYGYAYKDDPSGVRHIGPMAQDVEEQDKKAVKTIGGVKHIDTRRVMGNILRAG